MNITQTLANSYQRTTTRAKLGIATVSLLALASAGYVVGAHREGNNQYIVGAQAMQEYMINSSPALQKEIAERKAAPYNTIKTLRNIDPITQRIDDKCNMLDVPFGNSTVRQHRAFHKQYK